MAFFYDRAIGPWLALFSGFIVFGIFFAYILHDVPFRYGVSYQMRLRSNYATSTKGSLVEALNALFAGVSCGFVIAGTYFSSDNVKFDRVSLSADLFLNDFWIINYFLQLFMALDRWRYCFTMQALVDVVTILPTLLDLLIVTSEGGSTVLLHVMRLLRVLRVIRLMRLLRAVDLFASAGGKMSTGDASRAVTLQFTSLGLRILAAFVISAGFFNFLVVTSGDDWGPGAGVLNFHDAMYFTTIGYSTVGYGDIAPNYAINRVLVAFMILAVFVWIPTASSKIIALMSIFPRHSGAVSAAKGKGHVIVGCDASALQVARGFLKELFLHANWKVVPHVVLVVPGEPDLAWNALLLEYAVTDELSYLNGDLRNVSDLDKARLFSAKAVFVLSDRTSPDTVAQDRLAVMRALTVQDANPKAELYCLVTHTETRTQLVHMGFDRRRVVCANRLVMQMLSAACREPGLSTVVANLVSHMPELDPVIRHLERRDAAGGVHHAFGGANIGFNSARGSGPGGGCWCRPRRWWWPGFGSTSDPLEGAVLLDTEVQYLKGLRQMLVRVELGAYYAGHSFRVTALDLYRNCNVVLIAVAVKGDDRSAAAVAAAAARARRVSTDSVAFDGNASVRIGARAAAAAAGAAAAKAAPIGGVMLYPGADYTVQVGDKGYMIAHMGDGVDRVGEYCREQRRLLLSTGTGAGVAPPRRRGLLTRLRRSLGGSLLGSGAAGFARQKSVSKSGSGEGSGGSVQEGGRGGGDGSAGSDGRGVNGGVGGGGDILDNSRENSRENSVRFRFDPPAASAGQLPLTRYDSSNTTASTSLATSQFSSVQIASRGAMLEQMAFGGGGGSCRTGRASPPPPVAADDDSGAHHGRRAHLPTAAEAFAPLTEAGGDGDGGDGGVGGGIGSGFDGGGRKTYLGESSNSGFGPLPPHVFVRRRSTLISSDAAVGHAVVITQSMIAAHRLVKALCEEPVSLPITSGAGGPGGGGGAGLLLNGQPVRVIVVCPFHPWNADMDHAIEADLRRQVPGEVLRIVRGSLTTTTIAQAYPARARLVCLAAAQAVPHGAAGMLGLGGGDSVGGGSGGGGDGGGIGGTPGGSPDDDVIQVFADVLLSVGTEVRVVMALNDARYAEQHAVLSTRMRHLTERTAATRRVFLQLYASDNVATATSANTVAAGAGCGGPGGVGGGAAYGEGGNGYGDYSPGLFGGRLAKGALSPSQQPPPLEMEVCPEYFQGAWGSTRPNFMTHFALRSGYTSGDVVLSATAELLLVQTYVVSGLADIVEMLLASGARPAPPSVPDLSRHGSASSRQSDDSKAGDEEEGAASRVPQKRQQQEECCGWDRAFVERARVPLRFWEDVADGRRLPTYGELAEWLLEEEDALALGIYRRWGAEAAHVGLMAAGVGADQKGWGLQSIKAAAGDVAGWLRDKSKRQRGGSTAGGGGGGGLDNSREGSRHSSGRYGGSGRHGVGGSGRYGLGRSGSYRHAMSLVNPTPNMRLSPEDDVFVIVQVSLADTAGEEGSRRGNDRGHGGGGGARR